MISLRFTSAWMGAVIRFSICPTSHRRQRRLSTFSHDCPMVILRSELDRQAHEGYADRTSDRQFSNSSRS